MTEFVNPTNFAALAWSGDGSLAVSLPVDTQSHPFSERFSGIVVNQGVAPTENDDCLTLDEDWVYQEFLFPTDYPRGTDDQKVAPLTGLQVFVSVTAGRAVSAALDYKFDYYLPGTGWTGAVQGTTVGAHTDSTDDTPQKGVWFDMYFEPFDVTPLWQYRWRFAIRGRANPAPLVNQLVEYDGTYVTINGVQTQVVPAISPTPLREGEYYPFTQSDGTKALLYVEPGSGSVYYSVQGGAHCVFYSSPNPLEALGNCRAFDKDGVTVLNDDAQDMSLMFRVLGATADSGHDFLGNNYRSLVVRNEVKNISTLDTSLRNAYWLSKPNPSKFGVENLYFDVRDGQDAVVVDRVHLDPLTPDVYFHVYYSNDDVPGTDEASWDNLMWECVPRSYQMRRKETHMLPRPITAKFIKVEFSHLQARYYAPGNFQTPLTYKKHPKWVLDYFLALYQRDLDHEQDVSARTSIRYDALDLAYNYYLDDIASVVDSPDITDRTTSADILNEFLKTEPSTASQVDSETLLRIRTAFRPFLNQPYTLGRFGHVLAEYAYPSDTANYSVEQISRSGRFMGEVTSLDQADIWLEKRFPVMNFYIKCRHRYKVSMASLERDRAYFAGVKEIAFTREHYEVRHDHPLYIESAGDNVNVERNDFVTSDFMWVNYATS